MRVDIPWREFAVGDHRIMCPVCGTKRTKKDMGVTILSHEQGVAHCFKCSSTASNRADKHLTDAERKAFKRRMDALQQQHTAEQRARQAQAAEQAAKRWQSAMPAGEHAYLKAKGVKAHGLKVHGDLLLIPLRSTNGTLHSLQTIDTEGSKRFIGGGRVKGCYHAIGKPSGRILVCEGYATGATLFEASGSAVAVAFNSGNLLEVAKALRSKYPFVDLVICGDDDWQTPGNPGRTAATEAARQIGGLLAMPDFSGLQRGPMHTDFNDVSALSRNQEVSP